MGEQRIICMNNYEKPKKSCGTNNRNPDTIEIKVETLTAAKQILNK